MKYIKRRLYKIKIIQKFAEVGSNGGMDFLDIEKGLIINKNYENTHATFYRCGTSIGVKEIL